jgi:hypothetical protein
VHRVLRRLGAPRLADIDRPTRLAVRYERGQTRRTRARRRHEAGPDPGGGGLRIHGRVASDSMHRGDGYHFIHAAVDDRSLLAYAEILPDERKETASGFMRRALRFKRAHGISVERVLTDNGSCYRSGRFAQTPGRCRRRTPPDPSQPPADQRQGRAVQPLAEVGVGPRPSLTRSTLRQPRSSSAGSTTTTTIDLTWPCQ